VLAASGAGARDDASADPPIRGDVEDADRRIDRFRDRLAAEVRSMRAALDHDHAEIDRGTLLERKRTVDMALAPVLLVIDAAAAVAADHDDVDLLRALRVEWREGATTAAWDPPEAGARARRSIGAWLDALAAPTADGHALQAEAFTASMRWTGCDAPLAIGWSIDAARGGDHGAVSALTARAWWRVPLAERAAIDFPLDPDGLEIRWDPVGASVADDRGAWHRENWEGVPLFNNPPDLWAVHDTLRSIRAPDGTVRVVSAIAHDAPSRGSMAPIDAPTVEAVRTVQRADGSVVRRESWRWIDGTLRSITMDIAPRRLVHHAPHAYRLVTEVEGHVDGVQEHRPSHELLDVPGGARLRIDLPGLHPGNPTAGGDTVVEWIDPGGQRAHAVIRARRDGTDGLHAAMLQHRAAADAVAEAVARGDGASAERAIDAIVTCHARRSASEVHAAAEWVLLATAFRGAGLEKAALRAQAIATAMGTGLVDRPPCMDVDDLPPEGAPTESAAASTPWQAVEACTNPVLVDGAAALVAMVRLESIRSGRGGRGLDAVVAATCAEARHEWTGAGGRMRGVGADGVAWFADEFRKALDAGILEWPMDPHGTEAMGGAEVVAPEVAAAIVARRIVDAVASGPMDEWRRARARQVHDAAVRSVMDAVAAAGTGLDRDRTVPIDHDDAGRLFARDRALIGNPLAIRGVPIGTDGLDGIEQAMRTELGRVAATERAVGPRLAAARAQAAGRRIIATAARLAMEAVDAWLASDPAGAPNEHTDGTAAPE
jgi:hypothetical protein